jgi:hypothetical protein
MLKMTRYGKHVGNTQRGRPSVGIMMWSREEAVVFKGGGDVEGSDGVEGTVVPIVSID